MKSEETKQQVKSIFEMVITGEQENIELAGTLIESLNLYDEFKKYAHKEKDKRRAKNSFYRNEMFVNKNRRQNLNEIRKATNEADKINSFLMFLYFKIEQRRIRTFF